MFSTLLAIYLTLASIRMNKKAYIEFGHPKGKPFPEPSRFHKMIENATVKILTAIIPKANPDFDDLIGEVDFWKIEYDLTEKTTWREIGFDKNGNSIVAMPFRENYGFWTDNNLTLKDYENFEPKEINAEEFDKDWAEFENKMKK